MHNNNISSSSRIKVPTRALVMAAFVVLWICALIVGVSVHVHNVLGGGDDDNTGDGSAATDNDAAGRRHRTPSASAAPAPPPLLCNYTVQSATMVADDAGRLCSKHHDGTTWRWDAETGCCVPRNVSVGAATAKDYDAALSCVTCAPKTNVSGRVFADFAASGGCCALYEACVACCTRVARLLVSSAVSRFAWCAVECRTTSASVDRAGRYVSERVYCSRRIASALPTPTRKPRPATDADSAVRSSAEPSARPTLEMLEWRRRRRS